MIPQIKRHAVLVARRTGVAGAHKTDGKKLVHLGQCAQQRDTRIEVRTGAVLDKVVSVLRRMRQRHKAWNPEIAGDVEDPQPAAGFGKLAFEIADVGIVELAKI